MHTFFQLVQYKLCNNCIMLNGSFEKKYEFLNSNMNIMKNPIYYIFIFYLLSNDYTTKNKFAFLKSALSNMFLSGEQRTELMETFFQIQRLYHWFLKYGFRYRFRKSKIQIATDVYLNPLNETDHNVIAILHCNKKYLFTLTDLVNLLNTSLGYTCHFFSEPKHCKNPYNNVVFNAAIYSNIYFFMKNSTFNVPKLIYHFFLSNFDLEVFAAEYDYLIRSYAIDNYYMNSSDELLSHQIINMFKEECCTTIVVHKDFPKDKLVSIMKPYLKMYLKSKYSPDVNICYNVREKLSWYLKQFVKYNPSFGKKKIVMNSLKTTGFTSYYEIEHIDFSLLNTQYEIYMKTADTDQDTDEDTDSSDEEDVGF